MSLSIILWTSASLFAFPGLAQADLHFPHCCLPLFTVDPRCALHTTYHMISAHLSFGCIWISQSRQPRRYGLVHPLSPILPLRFLELELELLVENRRMGRYRMRLWRTVDGSCTSVPRYLDAGQVSSPITILCFADCGCDRD